MDNLPPPRLHLSQSIWLILAHPRPPLQMLDEADDPGGAKIEEYGGPMALVLE